MINKNITIIGTSHISIESVKLVRSIIEKEKPDIIAIELDKRRLSAILSKEQKIRLSDIKELGFKGFLINLIGSYAEKKLGKLVGVSPGSEMKTAIRLAKKYKLKLALIDQDISITLKKLSKSITAREKFNFVKDFIKGLFIKDKSIVNIDLTKVPSQELIDHIIKKVKDGYPSIHKVLIEERNYIFASKLKKLSERYPNKRILAIIGAGHKNEVIKLLSGN